jgi:hypothetical protein
MASCNPVSLPGTAANEIEPGLPSSSGEPRSRIANLARYTCNRPLKFLKSMIARIDVLNFPGSCCG